MKNSLVCILSLTCGVIVGWLLMDIIYKEKPTLPKCTHPTEREIILNYERYEMYLDQMQGVKDKEKIKRLSDSLSKYRIK